MLSFSWAGFFPAPHAPRMAACKTGLIIPILQILSQYPPSICSTYTASIITACEHPSLVLGKCYYPQGRISTFSSGVMGGGRVLQKRRGHPAQGHSPCWQTLPAIFSLLLPAAPRHLAWPCAAFSCCYHRKPPFCTYHGYSYGAWPAPLPIH